MAAAVPNDRVPEPSVFKNSPADPSEVGSVNAVPPEVNIKFDPSDEIDSFESCNCSVGVPPESVNNNPVSWTCVTEISLLAPKFSIAPSDIRLTSSATVTSVPTTTFPVPAGDRFMSAFEPFDAMSFVVILVAVTLPAKVPAPSTSSVVPFNSFNSVLLSLNAILFDPAFLTLNSTAPSSEPSATSIIFPEIEAYCTSWSASFSPLNLILPK